MKTFLFFGIAILLQLLAAAQENNTPAQFPGGDTAWNQYINTAFNKQNMINQMTKKDFERFGKIQKVSYSFFILADGTIGLLNIEGMASQAVRTEIQRVLKNSPLWIPATINGKPTTYRKKQISTFTFDQ